VIIGLGGRFCSGKSTVASELVKRNKKIHVINFADKLKEIATDLFGMTVKDRTLLQKLGVKMREIRKDVWIDYVFKECKKHKISIIADVRFPNEVSRIKAENGKTIFIDRLSKDRLSTYKTLYKKLPTKKQLNHPSEKIRKSLFDVVIKNNIPLKELIEKIEKEIYE